jgi:alkylhydroperoxidase/carboxymuconolactone decarboxylase family protein YurZ
VTSPGPSPHIGGSGRFQNNREMKLPWMDPGLRELVTLAVLAALGCGLALSQGDLLFAAIFAAACAGGHAATRWGLAAPEKKNPAAGATFLLSVHRED